MAVAKLTPFALALGKLKEFGIDDHHVAEDLASGRLTAVLNLGTLKLVGEGRGRTIYFKVPKSFWKSHSQSFWTKMGSHYPIEKYRISEFLIPIVECIRSFEEAIDTRDLAKLNALPDWVIWVKPAIGDTPGDDWPAQARRSIEAIKLFILQRSNDSAKMFISASSLTKTLSYYQKQYEDENPGPKDTRRYRRGSDRFWFAFINALHISNFGAKQDSMLVELCQEKYHTVDGAEMSKRMIKSRIEEIWKECGLASKRKK